MPEKISKPREKTEAEKKEDQKLLEEIENDESNPSTEFDPLELQANSLPAGIKGSDGDQPHVFPVGDGAVEEESFSDDEEFGGIDDADKLTAD